MLTLHVQGCLVGLHSAFKSAGIPGAWGLSIAVFTIFIKGITYPLNYKQMASTMQMQSLQVGLCLLSCWQHVAFVLMMLAEADVFAASSPS